MSAFPTDFSAFAWNTNIASFPAIESEENAARLQRVEDLGSVILSADPSVSISDKLEAFKSAKQINAYGLRKAGAQEAAEKLYWLVCESPFAKQLDAITTAFSNEQNSLGRRLQRSGEDMDGGRVGLDALSRHSEDEQRLIAFGFGFSSLEALNAELEQRSAEFQAKHAKPAVEVTLSEEAKSALAADTGAGGKPGSDAELALAALKNGSTGVSQGEVALMMLEKAAESRAAASNEDDRNKLRVSVADTQNSEAAPKTHKPYRAGDNVNTTT